MKSFVAVLLLVLVAADKSDFPKFDPMHANCAMSCTFVGRTCDWTYDKLNTVIKSFTPGPANGEYQIYEEAEDDYIWSNRTTPVHKYVDDQLFEVFTNGENCDVKAKSRSQTTSIYDYDTNFCNMWNVLNGTDTITNLSVYDCAYPASDPATTCLQY